MMTGSDQQLHTVVVVEFRAAHIGFHHGYMWSGMQTHQVRIQSSAFANVRHAAEGSDAEDFFDVVGNIET